MYQTAAGLRESNSHHWEEMQLEPSTLPTWLSTRQHMTPRLICNLFRWKKVPLNVPIECTCHWTFNTFLLACNKTTEYFDTRFYVQFIYKNSFIHQGTRYLESHGIWSTLAWKFSTLHIIFLFSFLKENNSIKHINTILNSSPLTLLIGPY